MSGNRTTRSNRARTGRLRDRRTDRHIKVDDAASVVGGIDAFIRSSVGLLMGDPVAHAAEVARAVREQWLHSPVMLRVDDEFAGALANSDTDVELTPDWLDRLPFDAIGASFTKPFSLHDGQKLCHYWGFIACGITSQLTSARVRREGDMNVSTSYTRYMPFSRGDGVRCVWLFHEDGSPQPQIQTVSLLLRDQVRDGLTLRGLIGAQADMLRHGQNSEGNELSTLVPLTITLLMYLAASEPELDWPPPDQIVRPTHIKDVRIGNLGWRVGATLRTWRAQPDPARQQPGVGGWCLPPHIRKAHFHRVRVAVRNDVGAITGSRSGIEGVDWNYEMRWYPPTPVNAETGTAPTVRPMGAD